MNRLAFLLAASTIAAVVIGVLVGRDAVQSPLQAGAPSGVAAGAAPESGAGGFFDRASRPDRAEQAVSADRGAEAAGAAANAADRARSVAIPVPPEFARQFENGGSLAEFHERLEAEERDPLWAERIEAFLREHFDSSLDLSRFRLDVIECRASLCEVLALGYGPDAFTEWMGSVTEFIDGFGSDEAFEAFFGGPGTMSCGGGDAAPGVIALNCTFARGDPSQAEEPPAERFSLDAPHPEGAAVEPVAVDEIAAAAIESSRELYELHRRLEREARDFGWASYIEPLLTEYMSSLDPEIGVRLLGLSCRTTLCEVQMIAPSEDAFIEWLPVMLEFQRLEWHDLATVGLDGGDAAEGEAAGLVWFLERRPPGD